MYARLKNSSGEFWDFVSLAWVALFAPTCKVLLLEYDDGDPYESLYMGEGDVPPGGPWIEEAVDSATGEVIAFDNNVMGELTSIPSTNSTIQEKIEFIYQYLALKRTATSNLETLHKDDGSSLGTAILSDDGTTFTKNKVV
jgi:hypothetical protein